MSETTYQFTSAFGTTVIPVTGVDVERLVAWPVFQRYMTRYATQAIKVTGIESFKVTTLKDAILFAFIEIKAYRPDGTMIPGQLLLSPDAVTVAPLIEATVDGHGTGVYYTVIVRQARVGAGELLFAEPAAGMINEFGEFTGKAVLELNALIKKTAEDEALQEIGLRLNADNMIPMEPFFVSVGRTNERIFPFIAFMQLPLPQIQRMINMVTGLIDENEQIIIDMVPVDNLLNYQDSKAIVLWARIQQLKRSMLLRI